ncbi:hypothetical protein AMECASPLE_026114 [Ameca splendens]|uniref:Uncharacterized protein n=1 Tax=Ameca splendens TaxID=208324 RepID=A0ABV0XTQ9_9TELE
MWVHSWMYSGVDCCLQGLWARHCISLELLHCGRWVVALGLSSALLWGGCGSPDGGPPGVRVLWDICASDLRCVCLGTGGQVCGSSLTIAYFYGETLYIQACSHLQPQVFGLRC